jgi:hypothetical protein
MSNACGIMADFTLSLSLSMPVVSVMFLKLFQSVSKKKTGKTGRIREQITFKRKLSKFF